MDEKHEELKNSITGKTNTSFFIYTKLNHLRFTECFILIQDKRKSLTSYHVPQLRHGEPNVRKKILTFSKERKY